MAGGRRHADRSVDQVTDQILAHVLFQAIGIVIGLVLGGFLLIPALCMRRYGISFRDAFWDVWGR